MGMYFADVLFILRNNQKPMKYKKQFNKKSIFVEKQFNKKKGSPQQY